MSKAKYLRRVIENPRPALKDLYSRLQPFDPRTDSHEKLVRDAKDYWSASENDSLRRSESHWRSEGRWSDDETWFSIGIDNLRRFEMLRPAEVSGAERIMEWGPGGGSNVLAFASAFGCNTYYGVDISNSNLEECARQCSQEGVTGFEPILINPATPATVTQGIPAGTLDLFISLAVYQHFPSREHGYEVNQIASDLLRPGGLAFIQTRYSEGSLLFKPKHRSYGKTAITFNSYPIIQFWESLIEVGLTPLSVCFRTEANYAFYLAEKRVGSE
jgi:Methyltransferase domain